MFMGYVQILSREWMFYLCKSNTTLGVERPTRPAKYVKGAMPEAVVAKGDDKVDEDSEKKVGKKLTFFSKTC